MNEKPTKKNPDSFARLNREVEDALGEVLRLYQESWRSPVAKARLTVARQRLETAMKEQSERINAPDLPIDPDGVANSVPWGYGEKSSSQESVI